MKILKTLIRRCLVKIRDILKEVNSIKLNEGAFIHKTVKLNGATINGQVRLEEGVKIRGDVLLSGGAPISIGRYSSINGPNTDIISLINKVSVGAFTSIARSVSIQEYNHKFDTLTTYHIHYNVLKSDRTNDIYSNGAIEIGNDVWIGAQCVILSGAKIGDGVVVAANTVVNSVIPSYAIVGGTPAKILGYRFDKETIEYLENLKWWEWPIEKIRKHKDTFSGPLTLSRIKQIVNE